MDVVLNHAGSEHWWMKDPPTPDWFNNGGQFVGTSHAHETVQDPHGTEEDRRAFADGWFVATMPDLNQRNPLLATYLIQNSLWWIEYAGLSGLRVDTYPYSDRQFMSDWSRRVTEEYPHLNIVGEEWNGNPVTVSYWQRGKVHADGYVSYLPSLFDFPLSEAVMQGLREKEVWLDGSCAHLPDAGERQRVPGPVQPRRLPRQPRHRAASTRSSTSGPTWTAWPSRSSSPPGAFRRSTTARRS